MKEDSRRSRGSGVRGRRLIKQDKADPSEVKVLREAGWVPGPGGKAVGAGGRAQEGQLTLPGYSWRAGGWDLRGGAVIAPDGRVDDRTRALRKKETCYTPNQRQEDDLNIQSLYKNILKF